MIDQDAAQSLAQAWLDARLADAFIFSFEERPWGWVFFYESRKFLETSNLEFLLPDRSPVYVTRDDGVLHPPVADSSVAPEDQPPLFEATLKQQG